MLIKNKISVGMIINPLININHLFKQLFVGSHTTSIDKTSALCIAEGKTFLCKKTFLCTFLSKCFDNRIGLEYKRMGV